MKFLRALLVFIVLLFSFQLVGAQELVENEIVVIKGEKFVLHQVRTGETIYSITRDFKVDRSELLKYNPKIAEGLDIGEILQIPYRENAEVSSNKGSQKGDPTRFETHTIKSRKETPYFIAKTYGVTVEELYAYNPKVRKFRKGKKIRIPVWEVVAPEVAEEEQAVAAGQEGGSEMLEHTVVSGETLYSISKKYGVAESEIIFYNPTAKNLKAGAVLSIPQKDSQELEQPVEEIPAEASNDYFEHIIESGETMWGTTRKYKVSEEVLKELNPVLRTGFPAGVVIKIPLQKEIEETQAKAVNEDAFIKHHVKRGESLWGLAANYKVKIPVIKKYNPVLENRNLVEGETVLIPKEITTETPMVKVENEADSIRQVEAFYEVELPVEIPESCKPSNFEFHSNEVFTVALFLPLYLEANDTLNRETLMVDSLALEEMALEVGMEIAMDTTIEKEEPKELFKQFYADSENYIQFYEGVLLAIDSMQNAGMQLELNVFDTQRNADSIRQFVFSEEFLETDLILGPVLQSVQRDVEKIAAKNRIPIVSPLASQSSTTMSNPHYYQVVPSREYIAEKTAEMIAEEYFDSNFIVVKTNDYNGTVEGEMVNLIQEKLFNSGFLSNRNGVSFTIYDFKKEGPFGLRRIMSRSKENVVIIPSMNEGELSVAISNVNNLADDYSITLIGSNRYGRFGSINIEQYHNLKMRFIAPYWADYEKDATINFVEKFKTTFYTEPSNYGIQGYDVAFYFLNALKVYGRDFSECLPYLRVDLIQGNYQFEKISQFGGYMNQGVSVISYTRDYKVERKRTKGQVRLVAEN